MNDRGLMWHAQVGQWTGMAASMQLDRSKSVHIGEFTQSKYLKQQDIPEPVLWTIRAIAKENVAMQNQPRKDRCIVYFQESQKGMVLNKTNLNRTAKALGSEDTDDWIGKQLVLYNDPDVEMGGEIVGGLRVRAAKKKAAPSKTIADMESDVPFANPYKGRLAYVV